MKKLNKFKRKKQQSDATSSAICDLMSGLMIVFLFIAVSFMSKVTDESISIKKQQKTVQEIATTYKQTKGDIYNDLYIEFKNDLDKWHMQIDKDATIRFIEPDVFFAKGEATLQDPFKEILNSFFPRYITLIYNKHKENIKEVRIEGHTSTEWKQNEGKMDSYFGNMELSQDRTRNVLEYVMSIDDVLCYEDWLISNITANGMSYSKRVFDKNNNENKDASRRVEFKVITNSEETINNIIDKYKK